MGIQGTIERPTHVDFIKHSFGSQCGRCRRHAEEPIEGSRRVHCIGDESDWLTLEPASACGVRLLSLKRCGASPPSRGGTSQAMFSPQYSPSKTRHWSALARTSNRMAAYASVDACGARAIRTDESGVSLASFVRCAAAGSGGQPTSHFALRRSHFALGTSHFIWH